MNRYLHACNGASKKAMTLYRKNLKLSQELFTIISCFEIALRNKVDVVYRNAHGAEWLKNAAINGMFDNQNCRHTKAIILQCLKKLNHNYTPAKLIAEMDFGFWRYLFAQPQFHAGSKILLKAFPAKPTSTPAIQYNHSYVFNQLGQINELRNRIAHHEPICFAPGQPLIDTTYARQHYNLILQLFQWMNIDESAL
ncbi:Abi family protein [Parapedobacter sp. DT-150]|uniref:Abi family protein n=1 Tax=Parapedobacter sp. DT-150 TaxID=3396162 RepID=UPI003F1BAD69